MLLVIPTKIEDRRTARAKPLANSCLVALNVLAFVLFQTPAWYLGRGTAWWTVFTYGFAHGSPWHLIGNMFVLTVVGNAVNRRIGNFYYLAAYLGTIVLLGIIGRLLGIGPLGGSSGAIFAIVAILVLLMPAAKVDLFYAALFPITILIGLIKVPKDVAQWFIRWGILRTLAWVCLLVVPVVELWGLLWWRYSLGVWQWHHPAHLAGFFCGIGIVALLPARVTMGSRAEYS